MPCVVQVFTGLTNVRDIEKWPETKILFLFGATETILKKKFQVLSCSQVKVFYELRRKHSKALGQL